MSQLTTSKFEYTKFNKKCEELLIVLHECYLTHTDRVFVRKVGNQPMPFVWISSPELLEKLSFKKNSLFSAIKFLTENGLLIIQKADFVTRLQTNCYAINYHVLETILKHWDYYVRSTFQEVVDFDPHEHIKKVPAYKQRIGKYIRRKGIQTFNEGKGNCAPKNLLKDPKGSLTAIFQTVSNPLRGYLNLYGTVNDPVGASQRLSYGAARYATLVYKEDCDTLGQLIYQCGMILEKAVHGLHHPQYEHHRKRQRYVDLGRPANYFTLVGAIIKKEMFYPSRENWLKFASWAKTHFNGNLTEALKFKNIKLYLKQVMKKGKRRLQQIQETIAHSIPLLSTEEKMEQIQYAIASNIEESLAQKETRLNILNRVGPYEYNAWFSNIRFDGTSDYVFVVDSLFMEHTMTNRYNFKDSYTYKYMKNGPLKTYAYD